MVRALETAGEPKVTVTLLHVPTSIAELSAQLWGIRRLLVRRLVREGLPGLARTHDGPGHCHRVNETLPRARRRDPERRAHRWLKMSLKDIYKVRTDSTAVEELDRCCSPVGAQPCPEI